MIEALGNADVVMTSGLGERFPRSGRFKLAGDEATVVDAVTGVEGVADAVGIWAF